ncbi:hypothetical protein [Algoriphagus marinus]|uniref:hypothetical protein n=1 Tax=Algoriphagus marinus TaxID=1925762 RepID=UPI00094B85C0|nr:hypothetical protein [Algoriphagus marinus]
MKQLLIIVTSLIIFNSCGNNLKSTENKNTTTVNDDYEYIDPEPEFAHETAKEIMNEDFFWSPIEETGPFGSDAGSDCFYIYSEWLNSNPTGTGMDFLKEHLEESQFPTFDFETTQNKDVEKLLDETPIYDVISIDNIIISIVFTQLFHNGKVEKESLELAEKAVKRQLSTHIVDEYREDYIDTRRTQLNKILTALNKIPTK